MSPFDVSSGLVTKSIEWNDEVESAYVPFITHRALSYNGKGHVFYAEAVNRMSHCPKEMQFQFLLNAIPKGAKRFSKWAKPDTENVDMINLLKQIYGYSNTKAENALKSITKDNLALLKKTYTIKNGIRNKL